MNNVSVLGEVLLNLSLIGFVWKSSNEDLQVFAYSELVFSVPHLRAASRRRAAALGDHPDARACSDPTVA